MIARTFNQATSTGSVLPGTSTRRPSRGMRSIATSMAEATWALDEPSHRQAVEQPTLRVEATGERPAPRTAGRTSARFLRMSLGSWNPIGCLVSVIDDPGNATDAAMRLQALGFPNEHICLIQAADLLASVEGTRRRGLLARAACLLADWSDNASFTAEYLDEARRGHTVVVLYAPSFEQARLAHAAVGRYGAHLVRHYGPWVVRGLEA